MSQEAGAKSIHPGDFNKDLIEEIANEMQVNKFLPNEDKNHYCNIILKDYLQEGKNFLIINSKLMRFIC